MLIEFNKKSNLYDDLNMEIYNEKSNLKIIYNFIPIIYNSEYFILTSLNYLEGYLMDYRSNIPVKIYIELQVINLIINSVISFNEHSYNPYKKYDCYIDTHTNLLLIRFQNIDLEYIEINYLSTTEIYDLKLSNNIVYKWTDQYLEKKIYPKIKHLDYIWDDKFLNLPPIPYFIDTVNINPKLIPFTGSCVYNNNDLIGMVSYVNNDNKIIITPMLSIYRFLKYLSGESILTINIDTLSLHFNLKTKNNELKTNLNTEFGLIIVSNYYDKLIYKQKKIFKSTDLNISSNDLDNKLNDPIKDTQFKYLLKKNIIYSIDDYILNDKGYIIIGNEKITIIPVKSYIWLFKDIDNNTLKIKFISNKSYYLESFDYNYDIVQISDDNIKKRLIINDFNVSLDNQFHKYSSINPNDLIYIKYKNYYLIELNERLLFMLKKLLISTDIYNNIINKIISNKYSISNNKIIIGIKLNYNKLPKIIIINNYDNMEDLKNDLPTGIELKRFIINML